MFLPFDQAEAGRRVHVYWNLHRGGWSIRDAKTRLVIGHADRVTLARVRFVVSEASRQRVLRERCRSVHAWVEGFIAEGQGTERVRYNPYRAATFTDQAGAAVHAAALCDFRPDGTAHITRS